jgi:hypothetical protein
VRDLRVRWALEEAGWPYEEHVVSREDQASASYRELQPFGQVRRALPVGFRSRSCSRAAAVSDFPA